MCFVDGVNSQVEDWIPKRSTFTYYILGFFGLLLVLLLVVYWEVRFRMRRHAEHLNRVTSSFLCVPYSVHEEIGFTDGTCRVCLTEFEQTESVLVLPCRHVYHHDCIYRWMSTNMTCPECRRDYSPIVP